MSKRSIASVCLLLGAAIAQVQTPTGPFKPSQVPGPREEKKPEYVSGLDERGRPLYRTPKAISMELGAHQDALARLHERVTVLERLHAEELAGGN